MVKKSVQTSPWCPFCGHKVGRATDTIKRKLTEFPVGRCQCGAVYSSDATGHSVGAAMVETLVFACNDNWDLAWELMPEDDYLTGIIENYDEETHQVVAEKNIDGRAVRGVLFFVRLHTEISELADRLKAKKEEIAKRQIPEALKQVERVQVEPEPDRNRKKKRANKKLVQELVRSADVDELVSLCLDDKKTLRLMQRLLYNPIDEERWKVAWLIGCVTMRVSTREPGQVSELLHRLYESIHDSASTPWGMIETMGYVISKRPDIFGAFTRHLLNFLGEPSTSPQVMWSLGEVALTRPDLIRATPFYNLFHFLQHPEAEMRGLTARLLGNIRATEATMQLMSLSGDDEKLYVCEEGVLVEKSVADIAAEALAAIREGGKNE